MSTNPLATIAAWSGALKSGASLDGSDALVHFADCLYQAGLDVFEEGYLSEDLAPLCDPAELKEMPDNDRLIALIPRAAGDAAGPVNTHKNPPRHRRGGFSCSFEELKPWGNPW